MIAIGWSIVGDLNDYDSPEGLEDVALAEMPDQDERNVVGNLWRFAREIRKGDVVICPCTEDGRISYYVGLISSTYHFDDDADDGCYFYHRRDVDWRALLSHAEIKKIWPTGRLGSIQTCARVHASKKDMTMLMRMAGIGGRKSKAKRRKRK